MVDKKLYVILGLLIAAAVAEKKINLEDIERDNLRAESKSSSNNIGGDDASYSVTDKPEVSQQEYHQEPQRYQPDELNSAGYSAQQLQQKYAVQPEEYQPEVPAKYLENNAGYQQTSQPLRQYVEYQQVEATQPKVHQSTYEAPQQQLVYQPEVEVGNQYQSVQQKAVSEKYLKNSNKDALYVNIPMDQLFSYYPDLALNNPSISKNSLHPLLHRLATQAAQQISIPVYSPNLQRDPIYAPSRLEYQVQQPQYLSYSPKYSVTPSHTEAILPTKQPKKLIYQSQPQPQPQPQAQPQQYLQEIVYVHPGALYQSAVPSSHPDLYSRPSINLVGQNYAGQARHQLQYSPAYSLPGKYYTVQATSPQIGHQQVYQQEAEESHEAPETPGHGFDLPRLPAQNFKSGFQGEARGSYDLHYTQNHLVRGSGPKTLLDSYVPSRVIAARDSERYRERPIKLEGGFLPSKINFAQTNKKRKAE